MLVEIACFVMTQISEYGRRLAWRSDLWPFGGSGADTADAAHDSDSQPGSRRAPVTKAEGCGETSGCGPEPGCHVCLVCCLSLADVAPERHCSFGGIQYILYFTAVDCAALLTHNLAVGMFFAQTKLAR